MYQCDATTLLDHPRFPPFSKMVASYYISSQSIPTFNLASLREELVHSAGYASHVVPVSPSSHDGHQKPVKSFLVVIVTSIVLDI